MFGVPLADTVVREEKSNGIPTIVEKTINHIIQHHITHPGLFRVAGAKAEIDKLKTIFDLGGDEVKQLDFSAFGTFSVCDVLKLFFRSLPEPLLGYSLYKPIVDLMRLFFFFFFLFLFFFFFFFFLSAFFFFLTPL